MRNYLNSRASDLKQGGIRAFFDRAKSIENPINLGIGEPDLSTPKPIIDEAYSAMLQGKTHYTQNAGDESVRRSIASYLRTFKADYDPNGEIIITCGGMGAVSMALLCTVSSEDEVIVQDPQWLNYKSQIKFCGGTPVCVPVYEKNRFSLHAADIEKCITEKTKILMINSPNNPTGAVLNKEELEAIAKLAIKHDLLVISDEVYCELLFDGLKHQTIASTPGMKERTIIINSMSKTFAMTGWRLGFAAGPKDIIAKMTILQENLSACAPSPAQFAAKFALDTMCGVDKMRDLYQRRRDIIVDGLNKIPGVTCMRPCGSFYVFPNISSFGMSSMDFATGLLQQ
ncbi:MAG: pyridoxal phosphate-dependent aminotransferase, partial [Bacillota bacterium]|nr:pyridoxal phosphate-dependent aminotransferase [Bacillota bacterium]